MTLEQRIDRLEKLLLEIANNIGTSYLLGDSDDVTSVEIYIKDMIKKALESPNPAEQSEKLGERK